MTKEWQRCHPFPGHTFTIHYRRMRLNKCNRSIFNVVRGFRQSLKWQITQFLGQGTSWNWKTAIYNIQGSWDWAAHTYLVAFYCTCVVIFSFLRDARCIPHSSCKVEGEEKNLTPKANSPFFLINIDLLPNANWETDTGDRLWQAVSIPNKPSLLAQRHLPLAAACTSLVHT